MAHEVGSGTRAWADNQRSASASVYGWGKMSLRLRHTLRLSANRFSAGLSASTQSRTTQDWHSNLKSVVIPFGRLTFTPTGARPQCSTSARRFPRVRVGRGVRLHSQQLLLQTFGFFNDTNYLTLFEMNLFAVDSYDGALLVGEYLEQPTSQDRRRNARKDSEYRSGPFIGNVALCQ